MHYRNCRLRYDGCTIGIGRLEIRVESKTYHEILNGVVHGKTLAFEAEREAGTWDLNVLNAIKTHLLKDHSIDIVERLETIVKIVLRRYLSGDVSGEEARRIAEFQKEAGFFLKYKSYAIKAASPLGFSIFIQSPGRGFSFQQHVTHKTEVFHILQPLHNALVFICPYEEWRQCYEEASFRNWMQGKRDERYDRFAIVPRPGDVFSIDRLSMVHTVLGCILEEYATISTDLVDRLFDQNAGHAIPELFNRPYALNELKNLSYPAQSFLVQSGNGKIERMPLLSTSFRGGRRQEIESKDLAGSLFQIEGQQQTEMFHDKDYAASLFVSGGRGLVFIGEECEFSSANPPELPVSRGDILLIPAGISYKVTNESADPLSFSLQRIKVDTAFPCNLDQIS
jgi:hypothetical protein